VIGVVILVIFIFEVVFFQLLLHNLVRQLESDSHHLANVVQLGLGFAQCVLESPASLTNFSQELLGLSALVPFLSEEISQSLAVFGSMIDNFDGGG